MKKTLSANGPIPLFAGLTSTAMCFAILMCQNTYAQNVNSANASAEFQRCGTLEYENYLRSQDPMYDRIKEDAMKVVAAKVQERENAKLSGNPLPFVQYTIPIVVHVVWNTTAQNVSDAKVIAMVAQLNMDWARTNTDAGNTPSVWQPPVAANMEIQFCLATKDPSGNPTTGIVHKQTSTTSFTTNSNMKSSATGGDDPWSVNNYFNIWTCNLSGGVLGFANFPPINSTYGTVVHYCTVGSLTNPGTCAPYQYGRTLSHEIGHNFSLKHIWDGGCPASGDGVTDTPGQQGATSGCPTFPRLDACQTASPGIMFMNYMDYTDDACYNMFTTGQKTKCQSTIFSSLMSLANYAATACGTTGVNTISSLENNISLYPNPSTGDVSITAPNIHSIDLNIYNAIGEAVVAKKINVPASGETKINLTSHPDGIYLFEMKTSEGTLTKKIIINR